MKRHRPLQDELPFPAFQLRVTWASSAVTASSAHLSTNHNDPVKRALIGLGLTLLFSSGKCATVEGIPRCAKLVSQILPGLTEAPLPLTLSYLLILFIFCIYACGARIHLPVDASGWH